MIFESLGKISAILERHDERKTKELLKNEDLDKLKKEDISSIRSHLFIVIM